MEKIIREVNYKGNVYVFAFTPVRDDVLSELYYIVEYEDASFIMAYDFESLQLLIQGDAPDIAQLFEYDLGLIIESFNEDG